MGTKLVVALSNPTEQYAATRHNAGLRALKYYADKHAISFTTDKKHNADVAKCADTLFTTSHTYMNESGLMVAPLAKYYRIEPQDITVLHDDVDLPFGTVRIKSGGGEAGHNGLRSVTQHLGTQDYVRIRIGIGRSQNPNIPTDKHVLSNFTASEEKELPFIFETVSDAVDAILTDGVLKAQAVIN